MIREADDMWDRHTHRVHTDPRAFCLYWYWVKHKSCNTLFSKTQRPQSTRSWTHLIVTRFERHTDGAIGAHDVLDSRPKGPTCILDAGGRHGIPHRLNRGFGMSYASARVGPPPWHASRCCSRWGSGSGHHILRFLTFIASPEQPFRWVISGEYDIASYAVLRWCEVEHIDVIFLTTVLRQRFIVKVAHFGAGVIKRRLPAEGGSMLKWTEIWLFEGVKVDEIAPTFHGTILTPRPINF